MMLTPGAESRPLIIDKESPVFHRWFLCDTCHIRAQPDFVPMYRHHMTPVHKRGYPKDLRQMKQSVYRSPLIASDNDKQSLPQGFIRKNPAITFPLAFQRFCRDIFLCIQPPAMLHRCDNNRQFTGCTASYLFMIDRFDNTDFRQRAGHKFHVMCNFSCDLQNPGIRTLFYDKFHIPLPFSPFPLFSFLSV